MATTSLRNLVYAVSLLAVLISAATITFSILEGTSIFESLYFIALIITTVGTSYEVTSVASRTLVMLVLAFGMGLVLYMAVTFATVLVEGQMRSLIGGLKGGLGKMKKERNHVIVCGYGKLGKYVCSELKAKKQKYLIIERDGDKVKHLISARENVLHGDSLDQEVLKRANIEKAKGLIATLEEDSDNIYLVITATELNANLDIAAKAEDEHAVDRLHKIGANIVVLPQVVGGRQLANAFLELEKTEELETVSKK